MKDNKRHNRPWFEIEAIIVILMNFRVTVATGRTSISDEDEKRGADKAMTMLIEDFKALLEECPQ